MVTLPQPSRSCWKQVTHQNATLVLVFLTWLPNWRGTHWYLTSVWAVDVTGNLIIESFLWLVVEFIELNLLHSTTTTREASKNTRDTGKVHRQHSWSCPLEEVFHNTHAHTLLLTWGQPIYTRYQCTVNLQIISIPWVTNKQIHSNKWQTPSFVELIFVNSKLKYDRTTLLRYSILPPIANTFLDRAKRSDISISIKSQEKKFTLQIINIYRCFVPLLNIVTQRLKTCRATEFFFRNRAEN